MLTSRPFWGEGDDADCGVQWKESYLSDRLKSYQYRNDWATFHG